MGITLFKVGFILSNKGQKSVAERGTFKNDA